MRPPPLLRSLPARPATPVLRSAYSAIVATATKAGSSATEGGSEQFQSRVRGMCGADQFPLAPVSGIGQYRFYFPFDTRVGEVHFGLLQSAVRRTIASRHWLPCPTDGRRAGWHHIHLLPIALNQVACREPPCREPLGRAIGRTVGHLNLLSQDALIIPAVSRLFLRTQRFVQQAHCSENRGPHPAFAGQRRKVKSAVRRITPRTHDNTIFMLSGVPKGHE